MMSRPWLIVVLVAVIGLGAGVGIGAAAWAGGDHDGSDVSMDGSDMWIDGSDMSMDGASNHGSTSDLTTAALDEREFMEMMVPHHESAIEMAEIALEKSRRPQVRRLARNIISSQEAEIAEMRALYLSWYGEELVPSISGPHADVDMSDLESATKDFDRVFLRMMLPHHASAIVMADEVIMGEPREEIETLASEIIAAQAKEIGKMQEWRERWYPPLG